MIRPLCATWFPVGLVLVSGHVAIEAHAAPLGGVQFQSSVADGQPVGFPEQTWLNEGVLIAQIIPDDTLGDEGSIVVDGDAIDRIEGGETRGSNLFHSFEEFNVNTGQQVYFANPVGIENILSRVTGSNVSEIDGLLGVDGAANLFLLNPNGIIFGPNARLDISGAFTASTAEMLEFQDGSAFSAVNPEGEPFLTMSVPLGVQFGASPQGDLTNEGLLEVGEGQTLTLFGNTVTSNVRLTAT
ncbi:MAG: filamentous hemagglutinin N-terminal domain-containing protein [Cyanobacteria bacterium J06639_14]